MKYKFFTLLLFSCILNNIAQNNADYKELFNKNEIKCREYTKKNKLDSVKIYINKIDVLLSKLDSTYYYKAELIKGTYFTSKSDYSLAMKKLLKATQFFKFQKDFPNYYSGVYRIGVCYYYVNRREDAQEKMNEVVRNSQYVSEQMKINALSNLGALEIELGMINKNKSLIEQSKINLRKAILLNLKNKSYGFVTSNYSLLAEAYNQLGNENKALKLLDSAVYYSKKSNDLNSEGFALVKKANIFTTKRQYKQALKYIDKAISIYSEGNHIPTKIYAYVEKKKLLVAQKNYKEANVVSDSIYSLSIKNYDKRFVDEISEMKVKYNTAEKEREILKQRADLAEKSLLIQKRDYQIYGIIGLSLLFLLIAFFIHKQQKLKNNQLVKENKLKVALRKIETQNKLQEQRLRISRDLHDNIGAQLSFIISSIDNLQYSSKNVTTDFKEKLDYISKFTSHTIDQLRDTIWAMNKNEISLQDLHSRILSFIEKAKIANENVTFNFENEINREIVFTSIKGMNLFRVIQEAIINALKYADATKISIHFEEKGNTILLSIKDNGKGFDKKKVILGNGLRNMQERIDEVSGKLEIHSTKKGTIIKVICNMDVTNKP